MELNTFEDFEKEFPDEPTCIRYMWSMRDKVSVGCPYCGESKMYINNDGVTKKCSNKKCRARVSVSSRSFISGTQLKMKDWLYFIFMHIKTRGRFSTISHGLNFTNAYSVDKKVEKIFELISKGEFSNSWFLEQAVCRVFILTKDESLQYRKENYFGGSMTINPIEIIDLSDTKTYQRAKTFCAITIFNSLKRKYILHPFIKDDELLSETYLTIADNSEIEQVTGKVFIDIVYKTLWKLWSFYIKDHPMLDDWFRAYNKEYKKNGRRELRNWYTIELIKVGDKNKNIWKQERTISEMNTLIKEKRLKIKASREKRGWVSLEEFM